MICAFTDSSSSNIFRFHAYSSSEADRAVHKIRRDIFFQIGYQESFPTDKNTFHGYLDYFIGEECVLPLLARGDVIKCVIKSDHTINMDYPPLTINDDYETGITQGQGFSRPIEHFYIQPNQELDIAMAEIDAVAEAANDSSDDD